ADMFIVKLNEGGNFEWAKTFGSNTSTVGGNSLAISNEYEVYSVGSFHGTVDFDPGPGVENMNYLCGNGSIFILKLSCADRVETLLVEESCGAYEFGDSVYTTSGVYTIKATTVMGCDSIITLDLTVNSIDAPLI